jgi:DNA-binding response OmpR family regulator
MPREILLIDDSRAIHDLVRSRLVDEPIAIVSAYTGEDGVLAARAITPELILLDVDLPDASGLEICARLKADPATAGIPVIFLTAAVSPDDRIYGEQTQAADFISKPLNAAELRARVRRALCACSTR